MHKQSTMQYIVLFLTKHSFANSINALINRQKREKKKTNKIKDLTKQPFLSFYIFCFFTFNIYDC